MMALIRWVRDRFSQNIQTRLTGYFLLILAAGHHQPVCGGTVPDILYEQAVERTEMALSSAMNHFDLARKTWRRYPP